jgi:Surface-adhesin protein E
MLVAAAEPTDRWVMVGYQRDMRATVYVDVVSLDITSRIGWVSGWVKMVFDKPGKFAGKPVTSVNQRVTARCDERTMDSGMSLFHDQTGSLVGQREGEGNLGPVSPESGGEAIYLYLCQQAGRPSRKPAQAK